MIVKLTGLYFVLTLAVSPVCSQIPLVFQQGLGGYQGTADTYYLLAAPDQIVGDKQTLKWDLFDGDSGGAAYSVIRFDDVMGDNPGQIPPGAHVIGANLAFKVVNPSNKTQTTTLHELLSPFDEMGNLRSFTGGIRPQEAKHFHPDRVAEIPGSGMGEIVNIDVTESIKRWLKGKAENYGWIFVPGDNDGIEIFSKESLYPPTLTVLLEGIAPPSATRVIQKGQFSNSQPVEVAIHINSETQAHNITVIEWLPNGCLPTRISDNGVSSSGTIVWNLPTVTGTKTIHYSAWNPSHSVQKAVFDGVVNQMIPIRGDRVLQPIEPVGIFDGQIDIGDLHASGLDGNAQYEQDNGFYFLTGSGYGVWKYEDYCHFLYKEIKDDTSLIVTWDIKSLTYNSTFDSAGVMVRDTLQCNSAFAYAAMNMYNQDFTLIIRDREGQASDLGQKLQNSLSGIDRIQIKRQGQEIVFTFSSSHTRKRGIKNVAIAEWQDPIYIGLVCAGEGSQINFSVSDFIHEGKTPVQDWKLY